MTYAIIGFGKIGQALAKAFARSGIEVSVATTRDPESFASAAAAIGPTIIPKKLAEAVKDLIKAGRVRQFGMSEVAAGTVRLHALQHTHEKVGEHWQPKERRGPSDQQADGDVDTAAPDASRRYPVQRREVFAADSFYQPLRLLGMHQVGTDCHCGGHGRSSQS